MFPRHMRMRNVLVWWLFGIVAGLSAWLGDLSAKHKLPWQHPQQQVPR